jgi:hypothetical protein
MAQPGYATVIYRIEDHVGMIANPAIRTIKDLYDSFIAFNGTPAYRIQIWTGRYWARINSVTPVPVPFPVKSLSGSTGGFFVGTVGALGTAPNTIPASQVVSGGSLRDVAVGTSADIGHTYDELVAPATLNYRKTSGSLSSTALSLKEVDPDAGETVYRISIDSKDSVYWSGGLLVKADL